MSDGAEPFAHAVRRLSKEQDISLERIGTEAWDPEDRGTSQAHFKKVLRGERRLPLAMAERVADVLKVAPELFAEYRLARMRRLFDERDVGTEQALRNFDAVLLAFPAALQAGDDLVQGVLDQVTEHVARRVREIAQEEVTREDDPAAGAPPPSSPGSDPEGGPHREGRTR